MTIIEGKEYLTVPQVARQMNVTRRTALRWVRTGLLPAVDMGEGSRPRRLISADALRNFEPPKRNVARVKTALARNAGDIEYFSVSDLVRRLGVHRNTVYNWLKDGLLPAVDLGQDSRPRYLIPTSALDGFELPSASGPGRPAGSGKKEAGP